MKEANSQDNYEAQTIILNDSRGNELFCYLEQIVKIEEKEYALLTPVDTPVSLFKINEKDEPELIEKIEKNEQILKNASATSVKFFSDIACLSSSNSSLINEILNELILSVLKLDESLTS